MADFLPSSSLLNLDELLLVDVDVGKVGGGEDAPDGVDQGEEEEHEQEEPDEINPLTPNGCHFASMQLIVF